MKSKITPKTEKLIKKNFSLEDLDTALAMAEDYMERAMLPFVLLGDTLKSIKDKDQVDGNKIELGVEIRYITKEVRSLFKTWEFNVSDNMVKFMVGTVPVEILIIKKHWTFLEHLDVMFYKITQFKIPNPWKSYMKARWLVK